MNRNHLIGFAAAAAVLGLLVFIAWSFFEIVPTTRDVPPSPEARVNEYLALDRWLEGMAIPVRKESSGNLRMISRANERQIFIQASLFYWTDEAIEYLVHWVEGGGRLFLSLDLDYSVEWNDEKPLRLLGQFGITLGTETASSGYPYDSNSPRYDRRVSFDVSEEEDALALKGWDGVTRLVQVRRGKGQIIVTGRPRFLMSPYIDSAPNARLAWAIFADIYNEGIAGNFPVDSPDAYTVKFESRYTPKSVTHYAQNAPWYQAAYFRAPPSGERGWLFIRGTTKVNGLLGSLFKQGNLAVLAVSVLALLAVSFWAVIPVFGLVRADDEKPGKPLRERFLAEGRFLKSYGALELYRDTYIREIKRRLARKHNISADNKAEVEKQVMAIWGKNDKERDSVLLAGALHGERIKYRDFPKTIEILMSILERI